MNSEPAISVDFENVPLEHMDLMEAKFRKVIQDTIEAGPDAFDLKRIHTISKIFRLQKRESLHSCFFFPQ